MSSYMDCPHCGSEYIVNEDLSGSNTRCPDCFQWVNPFGGMANTSFAFSAKDYGSSYGDQIWEELGYESGYDY